MKKLEYLLELGGTKRDVVFLILSGIAVLCSLLKIQPLPFDLAWVAIVLCGLPIILVLLRWKQRKWERTVPFSV